MAAPARRLLLASTVGVLLTAVVAPAGGPVLAAGGSARARHELPPAPRFEFGTGTPTRTRVSSHAGLRAARPDDAPATGPRVGAARPDREALAAVASVSFEAIPRTGGNWPADPIGAKGDSAIVTAVNTHTAVYAADGTELLSPTSLAAFLSFPAGSQIFDPKVIYDQYAAHFVLAFLAVNDVQLKSWIVLATIPDATAADPSTWCFLRVSGDGVPDNGRQWSDYPGLGYDVNAVTVTANAFHFRTQRFAYAQILRFPKSTFYDPTCSVTALYRRFWGRETRNPDGTKAFTIQPASSVGTGATAQYLVSYERHEQTSAVVLWKIRDSPTGQKLTKVALPVPKASISPFGTQRGGNLRNADTWWDPGDLRLINAFYDAATGRLYTAHVIGKDLKPDVLTDGYGEAAIRWYTVAPGATLAEADVRRVGIVGTPETDAGWPAIATDGSGNVFVTFSRASAVQGTSEYLSAWAAEIPQGSTTPQLVLLWAGQARMEAVPGPERWGDFNGINRDPVDPAIIAMINQFAEADAGGSTQDWQQTVDLVSDG